MSDVTSADLAAAKAILPSGVLRADDDDLSALAHAFKDYRESLIDDLYPVFDILPRLWASGYETRKHEDGGWMLYTRHGEPVVDGHSFRELCVNIVLAGL